ncbi:hypothetical protein SDC9_193496 [bioreactor metagenome]|uniref:Uncharacterized protein n=1 Tax=bioreactor metagenome TaxID=1076179 RepID=A0A645I3P2_9ZZZZ
MVADVVLQHRFLRFIRRGQIRKTVDFVTLAFNGNHQRAAPFHLLGKFLLEFGHGAVGRIKFGLCQQQLILYGGGFCCQLRQRMHPYRHFKLLFLTRQRQKLLGLFRLLFKRYQTPIQFGQNITQAQKVVLRQCQTAFGLGFAVTKF